MMPTANVIGTIHVTDVGNGRSNVTWLANFDLLDPSMEEPVTQGIDALYQTGIEGLEQFLKNH